jgi:hypothetical protein
MGGWGSRWRSGWGNGRRRNAFWQRLGRGTQGPVSRKIEDGSRGAQSQSSLESAPRTRSFVPARRRASSSYLGTAAGASVIGNEIRVVLDADSSELRD